MIAKVNIITMSTTKKTTNPLKIFSKKLVSQFSHFKLEGESIFKETFGITFFPSS